MPYPLPANELDRLAELHSYELDALPDRALDEIANLAAEICGAPMAVISVIEETRQWFKARVGVEAEETSRDAAFCAHTICESDLMEVPDATADQRFADNPFVTGEPRIRFYAGAPLLTPSGHALGTLCVFDSQPRTLSPEQRRVLSVLSRQVATQLELKRTLARRKLVEKALIRATTELEDRVRERTAELHTALERAQVETEERWRSEEMLRVRNEQLLRFESALLKLATTRHAELSGALHHAAEIAARTLGVQIVSVWIFTRERDALRCVDFYRVDAPPEDCRPFLGRMLHERDAPELFAELKTNMPIAIAEMADDRRIQDLLRLWGRSSGAQSMLSTPIRIRGEMIGSLFLGHSGFVRRWDRTEREFAASLASVVALALEADERERVEAALHESRTRLDLAVHAAQIGFWKWNFQSGAVWFSDEWKRQLGYEPDEIPNAADEWLRRLHVDDLRRVQEAMHADHTADAAAFDMEYRLQHRDGSWRWFLSRAQTECEPGGMPLEASGCQIDVTRRRQMEEQLHALAAHLTEVREDERKGLARELHDELGQMLTALRMDAAWAARTVSERKESSLAKLPERLGEMKELIGQAITTVQRIASDLRPAMLDELGLVPAMEWQTEEFERRSGTVTIFESNVERVDLPSGCALAFYRVLQEALTNVARHAEATRVEVAFLRGPDEYLLTVRDNGRGLPAGALSAPDSLGLIGVRERALALGGKVEFDTAQGEGLTVIMRVPAIFETLAQPDPAFADSLP